MARNRKPNEPIGTCPCPFKGCDQVANVFRYRAQSDDASRQRRAGKLYLRCKVHGQAQHQDYILEHATIWNSSDRPDTAAEAQATEPPKDADKPADQGKAQPAERAQVTVPDRTGNDDGWGFF